MRGLRFSKWWIENSSRLGSDAAELGEWCSTFRRNVSPSFPRCQYLLIMNLNPQKIRTTPPKRRKPPKDSASDHIKLALSRWIWCFDSYLISLLTIGPSVALHCPSSPSTFERRSVDCFIERPSPYRAVNTFYLGYKNQSVHDVSGTSRCLFSDKYKTHEYSVGRAYSCWVFNLLVHHITSRL
jgi:hypothetical protein